MVRIGVSWRRDGHVQRRVGGMYLDKSVVQADCLVSTLVQADR